MISKATIKFVHSLELKKNRCRERLFVAEGPKVVADLAAVARPKLIIATSEWIIQHQNAIQAWNGTEVCEVTGEELRKTSLLKHPQQVIALFPMREERAADRFCELPSQQLCLALDGIQDPGNLGTIIRIADWFGIEHIFCSEKTADLYNPKVVQATMGSIARVQLHYTDLHKLITALPAKTPVYGTLLDGQNIYAQQLTSYGLIVMGNEGNGISPDIRKLVTHRLLIPNYPAGRACAESLNVAIATAITCAEFRRKTS
ncbi:MAG: RNA methyltransferase [Prevotella sp.]|jgi:TrmH family RNA methyltransferase